MPFSMKEDRKKIKTNNKLCQKHEATRHATVQKRSDHKESWIPMTKTSFPYLYTFSFQIYIYIEYLYICTYIYKYVYNW